MYPHDKVRPFYSALAPYFTQYLAEKRVLGYRYTSIETYLHAFDRNLLEHGVTHPNLQRDLLDTWTAKRPNEAPSTQSGRCSVVRQFCLFLERQGHTPYIPIGHLLAIHRETFVPYIFNTDEIRRLFRFRRKS